MYRSISSVTNDLVHHCYLLQHDRSYRHQHQRILVEGVRSVRDLMGRHRPRRLLIMEHMQWEGMEQCDDIVVISSAIAQELSSVKSPEGCFAEYDLPQSVWPDHMDRVLVLDRLQDPGNIGTLLRTAVAFGVRTVFYTEPSCDIWSPKVLRAAKGAHFDMQLVATSWTEISARVALPIFVADIEGLPCSAVHEAQWMLVVSHEAHGPSRDMPDRSRAITIPMLGPMESLNVAQAGAILLYTLCR